MRFKEGDRVVVVGTQHPDAGYQLLTDSQLPYLGKVVTISDAYDDHYEIYEECGDCSWYDYDFVCLEKDNIVDIDPNVPSLDSLLD